MPRPDTRARVIQATIDCILDEGFYRASSNRIAERAGVTWGVIQYHFGTREALLVEVFETSMQELVTTLQDAVIRGDTFRARLDSLADVIWSFYRQPKFLAYAQVTLNLSRDPHTADETKATMAALNTEIGTRLDHLVGQVVGPDGVDVVPRAALFEILRGLAVGLALAEAFPSARRRRPRQQDPERAVLVAALAALVEGSAHA